MKRRIPIISFIILGLNVLGLLYEFQMGEMSVMTKYGMYQGAFANQEYIRAIYSAFLHFGFYHFACNMVCLISYGFSLETRIGPIKFALIYIVSMLGSALLIDYVGGYGIHAGASGAIWGLMTATLVYNLRNELSPVDALRGIVLNLVYSFSSNVSWQGHIGGGIAGLIAALVLCGKDR